MTQATESQDEAMRAELTSPPLLLLPGLLCDDAVWAAQRDALTAAGTGCVIARYGMADSIGEMARVALTQVPPGRFALAGHSMGGRVALEIMRMVPDRVGRIALLDTGYQALASGEAGDKERAGRHALLEIARREGMRAMGEAWSKGMVHPDRLGSNVHEEVLRMIERATPELFAAQISALLGRPDATGVLTQIDVPTLLLCGRDDAWSPLARHVDMQALVRHSTLAVVEHCGHMSTMEAPAVVSQWLREWLERPAS